MAKFVKCLLWSRFKLFVTLHKTITFYNFNSVSFNLELRIPVEPQYYYSYTERKCFFEALVIRLSWAWLFRLVTARAGLHTDLSIKLSTSNCEKHHVGLNYSWRHTVVLPLKNRTTTIASCEYMRQPLMQPVASCKHGLIHTFFKLHESHAISA
jgi:hypothetical protein